MNAPGNLSFPVRLGVAGVSFLVAVWSERFVEGRTRNAPALLLGARPVFLVVGSVVPLLVVAVSAGLVGAESDEGARTPRAARLDRVKGTQQCFKEIRDRAAEACVFGVADAARTIALVGDSHADHVLPALDAVAKKHNLRLLVFTKSTCAPIEAPRWLPSYRRPYTECDQWLEDVWRHLKGEHVETVLLARFAGHLDHLIEGGKPAPRSEASRLWEQGAAKSFARLHADGIRIVVLADPPWPKRDIARCLADGPAEGCALAPDRLHPDAEALAAERRAGARFDVAFVDVTDAICPTTPCPVVSPEGVIKFRDENHLTATFAQSLAPVFETQLHLWLN